MVIFGKSVFITVNITTVNACSHQTPEFKDHNIYLPTRSVLICINLAYGNHLQD
jgi:hypothetical protein